MTRVARLVWAVCVPLLVAGPLAAYLAVRPPNRVDRALSPEVGTWQSAPVEVTAERTGERLLPLWRLGAGDLSPATTIELLAGTYGTTPTVTRAELRVGTCVFHLAAPQPIADGATLHLTRVAPCADPASTSAELRIALAGDGRLALWTWQVPAGADPGHEGLTLTDPTAGASFQSVIRGRYGWDTGQPSPRRAALIAWLWDDASHAQTTILLLGAVGALMLGTWWLTAPHPTRRARPTAAGAGLIALGVSVLWAVLLPPLQGADEADHLLSYGDVVGAPSIGQSLDADARRVHFERIRYHAMERFAASDRDAPYPVAWTGDIHAERMEARSPLTMRLWRLADTVVGRHALVDQLLYLRLFNAMLFACVVAGTVAFVVWSGAGPLWLMVGLALMPTLPYFATTLSDWAYLASWSTLLAASIVVLTRGGPRAAWAGVGLGVSLALSLSTSIAAIALAPLTLVALIGRCVLRRDPADEGPRTLAIFWGGLAAGLLLTYLLMGDLLSQGYRRYDADGRGSFSSLLALVNGVAQLAATQPWIALVLVAAGAGLDRACRPLRRYAGLDVVGVMLGRMGGVAVAICAIAVSVGSLVVPMPHLDTLETHAPGSMLAYVRHAMEALLTTTRLRDFDHLTFASLWGGFGWVDAMLPPLALAFIAAALTLGVVTAALRFRGPSSAAAPWFTLWLVGGALSAATYAAAAFLMHRNLHGRYLLPLAIPMVTIVMADLGAACADARRPFWRGAAIVVLAGLHGASLLVVAARYF